MRVAHTESVVLLICAFATAIGWQMIVLRVRFAMSLFKLRLLIHLLCCCFRLGICPFGLAHVDTPKGDLDASSGKLSGPDTTVIVNDAMYPYGTEEQFPSMKDTEGNELTNSAHWWSECSNKGICDRSSGTCACFEGYAGANCQRADCPSSSSGVCSGHGVCESIRDIAKRDFSNIYSLWDEHATMGCVCDGGYAGADCSEKVCKFGADPLYYDDYANIRVANFTYQIYTTTTANIYGNYSLFFEDRTGEDWETGPISIDADCDEVTNALEALPGNVIPSGSVRCMQFNPSEGYGDVPVSDNYIHIGGKANGVNANVPKFTLVFPANPGSIKQIAINKYLDGARPTLYSDESTSTLAWHIYANGFIGEDTDYVPDLCEGVTVTLLAGTTHHTLEGLDTQTTKALKRCLGDSDGDSTNNVDVYNWDYGNAQVDVTFSDDDSTKYENYYPNPHLIKLIDATQDEVLDEETAEDRNLWPFPRTKLCTTTDAYAVSGYAAGWCANRNPAGFYAVLFYDGADFKIFNRAAHDYSTTTEFHVYTTTGYLQKVSPISVAYSTSYRAINGGLTDAERLARLHRNVVYLTNTTGYTASSTSVGYFDDYFGQVDCETNPIGSHAAADCLNKNDLVMFLNVEGTATGLAANPVYPNIHQVKKIGRVAKDSVYMNTHEDGDYKREMVRHQIVLDYGVNTNYAYEHPAAIYKFHPPAGFNYVAQCSNRGLCNKETGLCECFPGYTSDNCGLQNALAV